MMRFVLLPGQRYDTVGLPPLIAGVEFEALIADKAFDAVRLKEAEPISSIPRKSFPITP
jgi:hypothetical protein